MLRLKSRQRAALGETLRELANFAAAALVLGQFVGPQAPSWRLIAAGISIWVVMIFVSLALIGEN